MAPVLSFSRPQSPTLFNLYGMERWQKRVGSNGNAIYITATLSQKARDVDVVSAVRRMFALMACAYGYGGEDDAKGCPRNRLYGNLSA